MNSEMKNKTYKCEKCNHNFSFAWNLKQHLKHNRVCGTSEEEFKCPNCGKKFTLSDTLKQHFARCIAVDPHRFKCINCLRKFTFKSSLRKHLRGRCPNINYNSVKIINECEIDFNDNAELDEVHIDQIEFFKTEPQLVTDHCDNINNKNTLIPSNEKEENADIKMKEVNEFRFIYEED